MTKDEFRERAQRMINYICEFPDDLWNTGKPLIKIAFEDEVLVVGLTNPPTEEEEE